MVDNSIVYRTRLHWIIFFWPVFLLFAAGYLGIYYPLLYQGALATAILALVWFLMMWVSYAFSSLTIKKRQIILRTGVIVRQTIDVPMNKIESIDIRQSLLGSLLRYGSLVITGTGGTKQLVNTINHPLTCRRYIEQYMHD